MRRLAARIVVASLLAGLPGAVDAQEPAPAPPAPSFDELQAMIARMQSQVESIGQAATERDKALGFLTEQVEKAAGQVKGAGQTNDSLRGQTATLSDELAGARAERDRLAGEALSRGGQLGAAQEQLAAVERALADERRGKAGVIEELARTQARLSEVSGALEAERQGRTAASADLDRARAEVSAARGDLDAERKARGETAAGLDQARARVAALEAEVGTERQGRGEVVAGLDQARLQVVTLERSLGEERAAREDAAGRLAAAEARAAGLERELAGTREAAADESRRLQAQLATLTGTIAGLTGRLGEAADSGTRQGERIVELDRRLQEALAAKVEELSQYRSEFFGRLRSVLGERQDVRIVGDRFVLPSELLFASGASNVGPEGAAQLDRLAQTLREVASTIPPDVDWVLRVDGHTDRLPIRFGPYSSNWELSARRAISVVEFLARAGIPANRLAAAGFGENRPLDAGDDESAFRRNRRIEFKLTEG
jgi:chemotaxis protein MotB